jgi:hypothetical protein
MKTVVRFSRLFHQAAPVAVCLIALAGCHREPSPGHDEGHVGHVIPAHKPKTFPDAVRRLRDLNPEIGRIVAEGYHGSLTGVKSLNVAMDIANWLPEIAADSDMPEPPWNDVNARAAMIVADYRAILSGGAFKNAQSRVEDAARAISDLESLLEAADPRWFAGDVKAEAASSTAAGPAEEQL